VSVPGLAGAVQVYDENRTITPAGNTFTDAFTRTDPVHIYVMASPLAAATVPKRPSGGGVPRLKAVQHGAKILFLVPDVTDGDIGIYSVAGSLLRHVPVRAGCAVWDRIDMRGKCAAGGVYYASCVTGAGDLRVAVVVGR
jgi:hypothetical protein